MADNKDPDQERRKRQALLRLGSDNPCCCICSESDWRCLEAHHIAGQAHNDTTVPVCRNCHRKLSDMQRDHPPTAASGENFLETVGRFLLGLANMFRRLMETLTAFGNALIEHARQENSGAVP